MLKSIIENAKYLGNISAEQLIIKAICVNQGSMFRYFKLRTMGHANEHCKRFNYINIILEQVCNQKEV